MSSIGTLLQRLHTYSKFCASRSALTFLVRGDDEVQVITYAELDKQARVIAYHLKRKKLVGKSVLLLFPSCNEYITAFLGCLYAGVLAVPAYPPRNNHHATRLTAIIEDANAKAVLTLKGLLPRIKEQIVVDCYWATDELDQDVEGWMSSEIMPNDIAYLQYTSGSTGDPKGVMVSHTNIVSNCELLARSVGLGEGGVYVSWLPIFHDMGLVIGILLPLFQNATAVFMAPERFIQRPIRWVRAISRYKAIITAAPNFAYDMLVRRTSLEEREGLDLNAWKVAVNGAEPVHQQTLENFIDAFSPYGFQEQNFFPGYGMAEATLVVSCGDLERAELEYTYLEKKSLKLGLITPCKPSNSDAMSVVACGRLGNDPRVVIVNPESGELAIENRVGEIWLAGSSICEGYWNKPDINQQMFGNHLAQFLGEKFFRSGDLGFIRNDQVYITGRLKDLIIIRGENHYPQDIERTVESAHIVLRKSGYGAAFTSEIDNDSKLIIVQEVERTLRKKVDVMEVARAISKAIVDVHGLQVGVIALVNPGAVPKTSSGKIQRRNCRDTLFDNQFPLIGLWVHPQCEGQFQNLLPQDDQAQTIKVL